MILSKYLLLEFLVSKKSLICSQLQIKNSFPLPRTFCICSTREIDLFDCFYNLHNKIISFQVLFYFNSFLKLKVINFLSFSVIHYFFISYFLNFFARFKFFKYYQFKALQL